jgi:hypothetical protein
MARSNAMVLLKSLQIAIAQPAELLGIVMQKITGFNKAVKYFD